MKKLIICMLFVILVFSSITHASATGPLSELYYYSEFPDSNTYSSNINSSICLAGYDGKRYCDTNAYYVRRTMASDAIFVYTGHGNAGCLISTPSNTSISARIVQNNDVNYSLEAKFANTTNKLKQLRLAYFGSCFSDASDPVYGRLTSYITSTLGADVAIGYSDEIYDPYQSDYDEMLFNYLRQGYTVYVATTAANSEYINTYSIEDFVGWNIDSQNILGNSSTKIVPASFGVQ
jgi:hypothetical protein